jgi:hypothetical protein
MPTLADVYAQYGDTPAFTRDDGTKKGQGFLGVFPTGFPGGPQGVASEYSIAESDDLKTALGKYLDYPALVPGLTPDEITRTMWAINTHRQVPESVIQKATAFALQRKAEGKPFFADARESPLRIGNTMIAQPPMAVSHGK